MRKFYYLLAIVTVAATSCQQEVVYNNTPKERTATEKSASPYAVSEEEALARLDAELASLYGEETRANQRQVRSIKPIKLNDISPVTRSSDLDVDNLLYIVEFEDGQGSAILGADERVEGVLAILDNSALTAEDFDNAANNVKNDELSTYLAGAIANEAVEQASANPYVVIPDSSAFRVTIVERVEIANYHSVPCLDTCWGGNGFFNDYCVDSYGDDQNVPAWVVAAAQVINENYTGTYLSLDGEIFNMSLIRTITHDNPNPTQAAKTEVARFLAKICELLNVNFDNISNTADKNAMVDLFDTLPNYDMVGWTATSQGAYSFFDGSLKEALYDNNTPFIMEGVDDNIHMVWYWVIDGYSRAIFDNYECTYEGGILISREYVSTISTRKVHCNFGKNGAYNGYYTYGIFDWANPRTGNDFNTEHGDAAGTVVNTVYDSELKVFTYEL